MNQNEAKLSKEEQKAKIRERYRGHVSSDTVVIPGKPQADLYDDTETKRVAVYARVSTDNVQQTSSYELQKNYYEDQVKRHPNWTLVGIYPDEGISGTSLQHRAKFNQMIADCRAGKIDLIITKSVSRFARNIVDCISLVRELASLNPPVGVFFESENIFTLKDNTEMSLSFVATMAQEESHIKSTIMNASIEMRFGREIYLTPVLLGYDHDEDGNLVINEEEANTVRLIFFMYLYGYTCQEIADTLTQLGRKTKKGNFTWSASSVLQQLRNERHCGALLARKTFTPHYLDHKSKKNTGERTQYYKKHHHEGIISYDDFIAVQHLIDNARYGNKGILPELQVIPEGALKGFVVINPRWAGFQAADYEVASESVYENEVFVPQSLRDVEAQSGDFDLRGYEIARVQFFNTQNRISVSLSNDYLLFSTACIRKFDNAQYVELLIHPHEHLLAVRKCDKDARNAIKWAKLDDNGNYGPRHISGAAFISTIFELFDWRLDCKYRVRGVRRQKDNEAVLVFDMRETEMFVPSSAPNPEDGSAAHAEDGLRPLIPAKNSIVAFPSAWADNFGSNFYRHAQARELAAIDQNGEWQIGEEAQPYSTQPELNVTTPEEAAFHIERIIRDMRQGGEMNGTIQPVE